MSSPIPVREADVLSAVKDFLTKKGLFWLRLNSGKVKVRGGWMQLCPEGTPDLQVIKTYQSHPFVFQHVVWIETKQAKGRHADAQKEFQAKAQQRGEVYILARSLDDVIAVLK